MIEPINGSNPSAQELPPLKSGTLTLTWEGLTELTKLNKNLDLGILISKICMIAAPVLVALGITLGVIVAWPAVIPLVLVGVALGYASYNTYCTTTNAKQMTGLLQIAKNKDRYANLELFQKYELKRLPRNQMLKGDLIQQDLAQGTFLFSAIIGIAYRQFEKYFESKLDAYRFRPAAGG